MKYLKLNCGIYQIRNILDNKRYIGSSTNLSCRKSTHFKQLEKNNHDNSYLQYSYNKYGKGCFIFEILCYTEKNINYLLLLENNFIKFYKSNERDWGYNLRKEVNNNFGTKRSEETKLKMSLSSAGRKISEEGRSHMRKKHCSYTHKPFTEKHCKNISKSKIGIPIMTEERKYSLSKKEEGSSNFNSKFNEDLVLLIKGLLAKNFSVRELSKIFCVDYSTINRIKLGIVWKQVVYIQPIMFSKYCEN
jgi:group I intron endonuclease